MANLWAIAKELKVFPNKIEELAEIPHTISYVIRKRMQIDSLNELPEEKRPPDYLIWWSTPEELDHWIKQVIKDFHSPSNSSIKIPEHEIEYG